MNEFGQAAALGTPRHLRDRKRAAGLREVRIWVPDIGDNDFVAEARRQALIIREADDEADAIAFFEAAADTDGWDA